VKGLWLLELERDGRRAIAFMDYGKKNIIAGTIFPLSVGKTVMPSVRPSVPAKHDGDLIDPASIPVDYSIILGNPQGIRKLYVFTDPDCAYCRKLHVELKKLEKITPDVAIYVMLYPLQIHPQAYDKSRKIIAAKSLEMLERAFNGGDLPQPIGNEGSEAVDAIISFADNNGISGTPTLVLPDGRIMIGLKDADSINKMLEGK
jgi:thiol:disulfide interchange protein DsbC